MITLVCTSSLYLGLDGMMDFNFPFDADVFLQKIRVTEGEIEKKVQELEGKYGVEIEVPPLSDYNLPAKEGSLHNSSSYPYPMHHKAP